MADPDGNEVIYASGGTPGKQTVPRAELYVLLQLACHPSGELLVHTDAEYVIKGCRKGPTTSTSAIRTYGGGYGKFCRAGRASA